MKSFPHTDTISLNPFFRPLFSYQARSGDAWRGNQGVVWGIGLQRAGADMGHLIGGKKEAGGAV